MSREIVAVEANTPEWHEWRATVRTASQAPVIMGAAPSYWQTRTWDQLRNEPVGERPAPDEFTQALYDRGHRMEQQWLKAHVLRPRPVCLQRGPFSASLDGHIDDPLGFQWWEIKTVRNARSKLWQNRCTEAHKVPAHVWWQLVHQAHVVGDPSAICLLVVVLSETEWYQLRVNASLLLDYWHTLEEQWEQYAAGGQPGLADDAWLTAAGDYLAAKEAADSAAETLKQARATVLGLAAEQDGKAVGGGIQVITSSRQGSIDYKTMAREWMRKFEGMHMQEGEFDEEAERFRKPDFPIQSIRKTR